MSFIDNGGNGNPSFTMPVAPMYTGGGYGGGYGFGDGGLFWIIILFLFAFMGNGWGNGFGNGGMMPFMMNNNTNNDVQRGFDQQAVMGGLNGISGAINSLAQGQCAGFAGVNANMSNGFAQSEISANARQMANMNQLYGMQTGLGNQLNTIAMNQQNCCCENRAAVADLKYTVATEACADRSAVDGALRDVTAQGVANTQAILNTMNAGIQSIKDQMCQDKIDAKNETIANLRQQLAMKDLAASQNNQTGTIQAGQRALANEIEQYVAPNPKPAYIVQNPGCCNPMVYGYNGCGCGVA